MGRLGLLISARGRSRFVMGRQRQRLGAILEKTATTWLLLLCSFVQPLSSFPLQADPAALPPGL